MKVTRQLQYLVIGVVVMLLAVTAQVSGVDEDYEEYALGTDDPEPSAGWATWDTDNTALDPDVQSCASYAIGTSQCLVFDRIGGTGNTGQKLSLGIPAETDTVTFEVDWNIATPSGNTQTDSLIFHLDSGQSVGIAFGQSGATFGGFDPTKICKFVLFGNPTNCGAVTSGFGEIQITLDYVASTYSLLLDGNPYISGVPFTGTGNATGIIAVEWYNQNGQNGWLYTVDNLDFVGFTFNQPDPPDGVKAQVIDNQPGDEIVFIQWLSSPNDDGSFDYELYANASLIATRTAGEDTDGVWAYTHNGDLADEITYHVVATSFTNSNNSCTVTVNTTNQGNTDSCGSPIPGFEEAGSDLTGPNGALFGGSRSALATALQISETSLGFLIGAFLTMLLTAGLYFYFKVIGGIIGAVIGLTISYSTNLLPAWSLYVLIFTTLAGVILWTRTRPMRGM